jgi:glycosyltransferase involved in cell wall biosynthesis
MNPRGGTELQLEFLEKHVDKKLLNEFQITTSVPEKIPLHPTKINILWQKNSYDQPNLAPWFNDKSNHKKYDWYVFNSHWNYEKFRYKFDIPTERCTVIKNGVVRFPKRTIPYQKGEPVKLIYHPTPWRGLSVLLAAMQHIKNPLITLDVYSSTQVYGDAFKSANDDMYKPLYDQAKQLSNVNYIGYKPHEYLLEHLKDYHIFAYPSIWEETFCISALEAMAAGLYCITTNYGALFETCSEWPIYVPYEKDYYKLGEQFAAAIESAVEHLHEPHLQKHLNEQSKFVDYFYNWDKQGNQWTNFLTGALNARLK